jgi:hypothetical protein
MNTIYLNTSIDVITFHIVFVHTFFLLCLVDMNRLRFYFNNLINMFIKKQSSIKIFFRERTLFYSFKSNKKISDLNLNEFKIFTSKWRNDIRFSYRFESISMINDLQINLKIKHSRKIDNLYINIKNEYHSMIRWYDYAFFLKHFYAVLNCEIFRSKFFLFHENRITSSLSTIRLSFDFTSASNF